MKALNFVAIATLVLVACSPDESQYDASGTFESIETIVSAEASGTIKEFRATEGQNLKKGEIIGYIDSTQLYLKKKQLHAQVQAVLSKRPDIAAQLAALKEQVKHAEKEQLRVANLAKSGAATQRQLDDATAQVLVYKKQIEGLQSSLSTTSNSLREESVPLNIQIEQVNDQLAKSKLINEVSGTVLVKYAQAHETTLPGKPLYKIADLSSITLRAYVTGDQLPGIKLNQSVKVLVDASDEEYKIYPGTIEWISSKAEFTPKTIQTKDERANLVYAIKIRVKNDGFLKIGMYGEVKF